MARRLVPVARQIRSAIDAALTPDERAAARSALGKVLARLNALIEATPGASDPPARDPGARRRRPVPPGSPGPHVPGRPRSPAARRGSP
jgi:hypothetical protein